MEYDALSKHWCVYFGFETVYNQNFYETAFLKNDYFPKLSGYQTCTYGQVLFFPLAINTMVELNCNFQCFLLKVSTIIKILISSFLTKKKSKSRVLESILIFSVQKKMSIHIVFIVNYVQYLNCF